MSSGTTVEGRSVLVTGANRGVGQALVEEALEEECEARVCRNAPAFGLPG
jgi:NAD(P)-dependent dehydrogenase (short-subunit alcohol dehydrogenase family)